MTQSTIIYSSNTTITMDLSSVATSATFIAGVESGEIDNTANKYVDALVSGKVTVGTTPTANTFINIYLWGADTSLGTTAIDVLDGTSSAETLTNTGVLFMLRLAASIAVIATTSNVTYNVLPFSVRDLFGAMPKFWGIFAAHNTGVNLNATNNNLFEYVGIEYSMA